MQHPSPHLSDATVDVAISHIIESRCCSEFGGLLNNMQELLIFSDITGMRQYSRERRLAGKRIALVPTMVLMLILSHDAVSILLTT